MNFSIEEKKALVENAVAQIENEFGKGSIMTLEDAKAQFAGMLGGIPRGRILEVSSEFGGKATLTLHMIAEAQKAGGFAAFVDAKRALDPVYAEFIGVDLKSLYVSRPENVDQALEIIKKLIGTGGFDIIVIDSPDEQQERLSRTLRGLTDVVEKTGTCVVFINRFRDKENVDSEPKAKKAPKPRVEKKCDVEKDKPYMPALPTKEYVLPPKTLLQPHVNPNFISYVENWDELKEIIEEKMKKYGVDAYLIDATKGPAVTLATIELGENCSINKLVGAAKDLRRLLRVNNDIAIIPQLPDSCYSGIEIPNKVRNTVSFQEVICSKEYSEAEGDILIALGRTAAGDILIEDLAKMPHALIAGATGSGKSVCVNVIIASILCRYRPDEVKLILIDLKQVEMGNYSGLPHMLFKEPLSDIRQIVNAFTWLRRETENRFILFKSLRVRNLNEYNRLPGVQRLPRIVTIIDEASELMTKQEVRKTIESTLSCLARVARAAGIHLLFATQNPVKEVITNEVQNNLNTKIAFAVGDFNHSMVIFKAKGAECLLGCGDMYIKRGQKMLRGQCAYISTEETESIANYILEHNEATFDEEAIASILSGAYNEDDSSNEMSEAEVLAWKAMKICYDTNNVSCSYLQRKMLKGYNFIANVLDYWENEGFISKPNGEKKRFFLKPAEEFYALYKEKFGDEKDEDLTDI